MKLFVCRRFRFSSSRLRSFEVAKLIYKWLKLQYVPIIGVINF